MTNRVGAAPLCSLVDCFLTGICVPVALDMPWLLLMGIGSYTAQYCATPGMRVADATVVVTVDFMRLPLSR